MDAALTLATLGRRLRERRGLLGWTLKELASRSGLSTRFLVQLEAGKANISVKNLAVLASAMDASLVSLLAPSEEAAEPLVVALLGLRGAGKSTVGRRLARRLHMPFVELDRRIEETAGLSLDEIFALHGEEYYRRLERQALEKVLDEGRSLVLATGGGLPTSGGAYRLLARRALTVWLRADPEDHWSRVVHQGDRRPMADHPQAMAELRLLLASREPLYAKAAVTVDTSSLSVEGVVEAVAARVQPRHGSVSGADRVR
jgi:XRE family aerobic/anaerobic benzoate catabolism transcriptional regulator